MTESLYLALFVWAVVYFAEFLRALQENDAPKNIARKKEDADRQTKIFRTPLRRCAWCLAGAELTRYDGWFLAGVIGAAVAFVALRRWHSGSPKQSRRASGSRKVLTCDCRGSHPLACLQRSNLRQRASLRRRPLLREGDRAARRCAQSRAPQRRSRGSLFSEIRAIKYGGRELGPLLAASRPHGIGNRAMETAGAIGTPDLVLGSVSVLRFFHRLRFRADSCPHLVALCRLQPALRSSCSLCSPFPPESCPLPFFYSWPMAATAENSWP